MNKHPIVEVTWNDAWYDDDAASATDSMERMHPFRTTTVGYQIGQDEGGIMLSRDYYPSLSTFKHRHYIPAGMIVSIKEMADGV